jgi:hypothetical protein
LLQIKRNEHITREVVRHEFDDADKVCAFCQGELHYMGKYVTEKLVFVPATNTELDMPIDYQKISIWLVIVSPRSDSRQNVIDDGKRKRIKLEPDPKVSPRIIYMNL